MDDDHVGRLVRYYRKYMAEFSKGRKKKIKQLIPNKVWLKIEADYKVDFPASGFTKDSLQDHLRTALKEMDSDVNNPENGDGAEPQDEDIMVELMQTEGAKTRNVLRARNAASNAQQEGQVLSQALLLRYHIHKLCLSEALNMVAWMWVSQNQHWGNSQRRKTW